MEKENYYVIQGWMLSELGLKGHELMIYAIINGFSQDGQSKFYGSLNYIQDWTGLTHPTIINILKKLVEKDLIIKEEFFENKVKRCEYRVVKKFNRGSKEILVGGSKEILHNNIIDNNKINIELWKNFNEFYQLYPKRVNKKKAKEKYVQLVKKGVEPAAILEGVKKYNEYIKQHNIEKQYIKHPTTWLNGECWEDELDIKEQKNDEYNPYL